MVRASWCWWRNVVCVFRAVVRVARVFLGVHTKANTAHHFVVKSLDLRGARAAGAHHVRRQPREVRIKKI